MGPVSTREVGHWDGTGTEYHGRLIDMEGEKR